MSGVWLRRARVWAVCAAMATSACLGATKYRPHTGYKGGFAEARLDENTFKVSFSGNSFTSRTVAESYLMYRCAEVAVGAGFDRFEILEHTGGWTPWHPDRQSAAAGAGEEPWVSASLRDHERHLPPDYGATIRAFSGDAAPGSYDARELMRYLGPSVRR